MTTKKTDPKGLNGAAIPVMEIKKPEQATEPQIAESTQPTIEELQNQVLTLRTELARVPKDFNAKIEYFNRKRELIRRHNILEENAETLKRHLDKIAELAATNEFENEVYTLTVEGGEKYSKKQVFALQNPDLIGEVITYMIGKVEAKITKIKIQIEE